MNNQHVLVTGGAGYIGSHTCLLLLQQGYDVTVLDNLSNSSIEALKRVEALTGKTIRFVLGDICNEHDLSALFSATSFFAVIHFAGLKAVGESVAQPLRYYKNNVEGSLKLLQVMQQYNVKNLVFSSSATVYGDPEQSPIPEDARTSPTSPYGRSKLMVEQFMSDLAVASPELNLISLRYFNPVGAHPSGQMGEDPQGIPNNLMPFISQVAVGRREQLQVFGGDYPTLDGTGVRDYIHVMDLAEGHLAALRYVQQRSGVGFMPVNLGSGNGISVLQVLRAFEDACGKQLPYQIVERRAGDVPSYFARADKAAELFGWRVERSLDDMCRDTWLWQSTNPKGYE